MSSTPRVDENGPTPVAPPVAGADDGAGVPPPDAEGTPPADDATNVLDPGTQGDGDFVIGPDYPRDPALTDRGAPRGRDFQFSMSSADSAIFKGDDATLNADQRHPFTRQINVYVPAEYVDGSAAPILVIHDGPGPLELVKRALDNLTIEQDPARRLPAFIAIAVANGGSDSKGSERGLEYDTMSDRFARFIDTEVLPAVLANPDVRAAYPQLAFTSDPEGKATMGCSSGGAAALSMGPPRPVPAHHHVLGHLRRSARRRRAGGIQLSARRLGLPLRAIPDRQLRAETPAHLPARLRHGQRCQRARSRSPQLGHRQPAHRRGPAQQGLPLPLPLRPERGPLQRQAV
jgi:hypothetical protein